LLRCLLFSLVEKASFYLERFPPAIELWVRSDEGAPRAARACKAHGLVKCKLDNASFKETAEEEHSSIVIALVALLDYADCC